MLGVVVELQNLAGLGVNLVVVLFSAGSVELNLIDLPPVVPAQLLLYKEGAAGRRPGPAALAAASPDEVASIIRSLGFFRSKAKNLVALAQTVMADFGGEIPADVDALQKLPGVGRKTANCVMCEAFKDPQGIAVDTHVFRIAHRLKLAGPSADTPQKVEDILLKVYPREQWLFINHQWVHFGREFCRARNPRCADCIVGDLCPTRGQWG